MKRIGLLSDTHGFLDENVFRHFENCDEIWHAGDFGSAELAEKLQASRTIKGVYGNIDGPAIRSLFPETLVFHCESVKVAMTHIGGSPPNYTPAVKDLLQKEKPQLFVCGHSHILKIIYDKKYLCLYMNPGAAGRQGWHTLRTIVRFSIDGPEIRDCEVIELGKRGKG